MAEGTTLLTWRGIKPLESSNLSLSASINPVFWGWVFWFIVGGTGYGRFGVKSRNLELKNECIVDTENEVQTYADGNATTE